LLLKQPHLSGGHPCILSRPIEARNPPLARKMSHRHEPKHGAGGDAQHGEVAGAISE